MILICNKCGAYVQSILPLNCSCGGNYEKLTPAQEQGIVESLNSIIGLSDDRALARFPDSGTGTQFNDWETK